MPSSSRSVFNFKALADFRYAIRRYLNFSERNARAAGLEPQQYQALLAIKGIPAPQKATIGSLAERLQIQHHSAVELMDRLEARGLIRRLRSRTDRRKVLVELTRKGESRMKHISLPHREELRTAGKKLLRTLETFISHDGARRDESPHARAAGNSSGRQKTRANARIASSH
ncbi:MAG: MarR family winged helix-turn-helix transcriptional regulator [Candidatus Acidiferrales bacterium]